MIMSHIIISIAWIIGFPFFLLFIVAMDIIAREWQRKADRWRDKKIAEINIKDRQE